MSTLLTQLATSYANAGYEEDFPQERPILDILLPKLQEELTPISVLSPLGIGSTAIVLKCQEPRLNQLRALKFPRPRLGKLSKIIRVIRGESHTLASLNHQNVVKLHSLGEVDFEASGEQYGFPYFLMDFIDGVKDFDEYIISRHGATPEEVISWCRDAVAGVAYLHSRDIVHSDLKPGNLLLSERSGALVADLGYAKHHPRADSRPGKTEMTYSPPYAHPDLIARMERATDPAANVALIERTDLKFSWDLFSLGRTFRDTLRRLKREENAGQRLHCLTRYQWQYLTLIRVRLQDGRIVGGRQPDPLLSDTFPGLSDASLREIAYESADEALEDFEKLLSLYDIESRIPELAGEARAYIQIPGARVPSTDRVLKTIGPPAVRRLCQTTQLGFVSLVYPGAVHSRFEHSLGVFEKTGGLLRGLWYDQANCLFRSIVRERDLLACLVAALIHDLGQYPMAHDLSEVSERFGHEQFTEGLLFSISFGAEGSLAELIRLEWGVTPEEVLDILRSQATSRLRLRILHSVISGPLDADKLDYLVRDCIHLGVTFGESIDSSRLIRNVTTCTQQTYDENRGEVQRVAEIGVMDRAVAVADGIWRARRDMFRQVYWQHTVRSLKAMLAFAVRGLCIEFDRSDGDAKDLEKRAQVRRAFWSDFRELVMDPAAFQLRRFRKEAVEPSQLRRDNDLLGFAEEPERSRQIGWLSPSDDGVINLLTEYTNDAGRLVLEMIRQRRIFKRLKVISEAGQNRDRFESLYSAFRVYLSNDNQQAIDALRKEREDTLKEALRALGVNYDDAIPVLLLDVPVKSPSKAFRQEALWYLEEGSGVPSEAAFSVLEPVRSDIEIELSQFDRRAGKIRWLIHPDVHADLVKVGKQGEVTITVFG